MKHLLSTSVIVSLLIIITDAQTFQYSRGWTNGKRSSTESGLPNQVLVPRFTAGFDKPNDKLLMQHFLKSPCDVRLANALINRNKELLQQLASSDGEGAALLYDPTGSDSVASDDARFKRDLSSQESGAIIRF